MQADFQQGVVNECSLLQARAGGAGTLTDHYAAVRVNFNAAGNGYKPVLLVSADRSQEGSMGISVANAVLEQLQGLNRVAPGAVVSDNLVSFSAPLSDRAGPDCLVAIAPPDPRSPGLAQPANTPAPPIVAQAPQLRQQQTPSLAAPATVNTPTAIAQSTPTPRAPVFTLPADFTLPGSEVIVCGDTSKSDPCSDLDLVLAITATCPDDRPFGHNVVTKISDTEFEEYRLCASAPVCAAVHNDPANAACRNPDQLAAGQRCEVCCYGDMCNEDRVPSDLSTLVRPGASFLPAN
jgi:hypothetical protein